MMKFAISIFCFVISISLRAQDRADIIIRNGRVLDGTGNSWIRADIAIKGGKIVRIGKLDNVTAAREIVAKGMIVSPGFIDVHTHIEGDGEKNPTANNFILDGVTTVVTGNCGASHTDLKTYFQKIDSIGFSINVASLIGHNDVRKAVLGTANRAPSDEEMKRMEALVDQAMKDGAVGFSTGLIYIPGTYSSTDEVLRLAKVAARYNGVYA